MIIENYHWLAGLIAAHPERKVIGRTRLQEEVKLLQSLGFPTDYSYTTHFFGPYSEGLHSDIGFLEEMGYVTEEKHFWQDGSPYYIITAKSDVDKSIVKKYQVEIDKMNAADAVVLELAATYDAFCDTGSDHDEALQRLRRKKGSKCDNGNEEAALDLLLSLMSIDPTSKNTKQRVTDYKLMIDIERVRTYSRLLPNPGGKIVRELLTEIERLQAIVDKAITWRAERCLG
jgi:uncharacterized protein YwgA